LDIKALRSFVAVATLKNFSAAAKKLHITQPTISRQISELEKNVGVKLLIRTTHDVTLTKAGNLLFIEAQKIIKNDQNIIEKLRKIANITHIKIGYLASACAEFLPRAIKNFSHSYPNIKLQLLEMTTPQQFEALQNNKIDIALSRTISDIKKINLIEKHLYTDKMVALVPKHHSLADKSQLNLSHLAQEKIIFFKRQDATELYDQIVLQCKESGFIPMITSTAENMRHLITLVSSGLGVSIVPEQTQYICSNECQYIPISDLSINLPLKIYFKQSVNNKYITQFVQLCTQEIHEETFYNLLEINIKN